MADEEEIPSELPDKVPKYVTTQSELARLLQVHRNTVIAWTKEPDAPKQTAKGYDVKKWLEWAGSFAKRANVEKSDTKKALEVEKLKEVIRGLKQKNDEEAGLLVPLSIVTATITAVVAQWNQEVRKIEDGAPQALAGLGLPEQRMKLREMFDAMRATIHKGTLELTGAKE
jgi:hypothetical protein